MKLKSFISAQEPEQKKTVRRQPFYMTLAQSAEASKRVEFEAKHLATLIQIANASFEEYGMISSFRDIIKLHGASEGLMSCINADDQLARCLGIAIPEVTAVNAQAIGVSCCEAIDEKLSCSCGLTCKFMKDLIDSVNSFISALTDNAVCQKETIETVYEEIVKKVTSIDALAFSKEEICGYAQPVFMERVAAINEVISGLMEAVDVNSAEKVIPALQKLGFVVEANAQIRPETPAEAKATEPPKEAVMSAPVTEAAKSEEELDNAPAAPVAVPEPSNGSATDDVQSKEIAVLRWTPETIGAACCAVIGVLGRAADLTKLGAKVTAICGAAIAKCNEEGEKSPEVQGKLDGERRFAAFMSSALHILGSAINGLVDQCVCMSTKLKKCECCCGDGSCKTAAPAIAVTQEQPLATVCSKQGPRFYKKVTDESTQIPPMTVTPKEEGTQPAVAPAESGDEQKKVTQVTPPDQSMTVPEQPKPAEGAGAAKPAEEGGELKKVEPKQEVPVPTVKTKDENGLVEDPILAPTTNPVPPVKDPAPPAVPVAPAAPAEPVPPVTTAPAGPAIPAVAPAAPANPGLVEDPIIAPAKPAPAITQDNAEPPANAPAKSGDSQPAVTQTTPPDKSMTVPEQPKPTGDVEPAAAPAESGDSQKKSEQPEKVETIQNPPKVEEKPAENAEPLQHPENTVDAASFRKLGSFWI